MTVACRGSWMPGATRFLDEHQVICSTNSSDNIFSHFSEFLLSIVNIVSDAPLILDARGPVACRGGCVWCDGPGTSSLGASNGPVFVKNYVMGNILELG